MPDKKWNGSLMEIGRKKCLVMNCENHSDEGEFVGDLCFPCHEFVSSGRGTHSQAYRNARQVEPRKMAFDLELLTTNDVNRKDLTCMFCRFPDCDRTFTLHRHTTITCGIHLKCLDLHEAVVSAHKTCAVR
jgi:hypothetical protein